MITDKKIVTYSQLAKKLTRRRKNKKVVVATGTWDIIHTGHLIFLDFAKRQGDILVVGVGLDKTIKHLKGQGRPLIPEKLRIRLIAGFEVVDYAVLLREKIIDKVDIAKLLETIKPEVLVVPYHDHNLEKKKKIADQFGIKLVKNPRIRPNRINFPLSTTYLEEKLKREI